MYVSFKIHESQYVEIKIKVITPKKMKIYKNLFFKKGTSTSYEKVEIFCIK